MQIAIKTDQRSGRDLPLLQSLLTGYGAWELSALLSPPTRIQRVIAHEHIVTVAQAAEWVDRVQFNEVRSFGRAARQWLRQDLHRLAEQGPYQVVFGKPEPPDSISSLFLCFVDRLDFRKRAMFVKHFRFGQSYKTIGGALPEPVSGESVRKVVNSAMISAPTLWRTVAHQLLEAHIGRERSTAAQSVTESLSFALELNSLEPFISS